MAYPEPNSLDDIYGPSAEDADLLAEYDDEVESRERDPQHHMGQD